MKKDNYLPIKKSGERVPPTHPIRSPTNGGLNRLFCKHGILIERLRGFGPNKAAWVAEALLQGYKFEVLCDHFVVHMNHPGRKY
jgi:hypothetical protein